MLFLLYLRKKQEKKNFSWIHFPYQATRYLCFKTLQMSFYTHLISLLHFSWTDFIQALAHTLLQNAFVKVKRNLYEMHRWILKASRPWPVFYSINRTWHVLPFLVFQDISYLRLPEQVPLFLSPSALQCSVLGPLLFYIVTHILSVMGWIVFPKRYVKVHYFRM